ncbi:MAG: hypothetical protein ACK53L_21865, partial [Pirellulaceae bacterium]
VSLSGHRRKEPQFSVRLGKTERPGFDGSWARLCSTSSGRMFPTRPPGRSLLPKDEDWEAHRLGRR